MQLSGGKILLERDSEIAELGRLFEDSPGFIRLALLLGEPGIGKSALLADLRRAAREAGVEALAARGAELEQGLPFGVVRQLLEPALLARSSAQRDSLFAGAAGLARPLLEGGPGPPLDPDFGVLHGLYWLIASLPEPSAPGSGWARGRPTLLLTVDDLQWADAASLRFLRYLIPRSEGLGTVVVAALRGNSEGLAADLVDEPGAIVLRPRPLSVSAVAEMLAERLAPERSRRLAPDVLRVTGGVPLYVLAVIEELAADGNPTDGGVLDAIGPDAVARSLLRRLASLGSDARALAEGVAILGDGVRLGIAARLAGLDEELALECALMLRDAAVFAPGERLAFAAGERLAFAHPVLRASLYRQLERDAPMRHHRAGRLLIEMGASNEEVALQLLRAAPGLEPHMTAVLRDAAGEALQRGAPETATSLLVRVLAESLDEHERIETLLELGGAEARAGARDALEHLRQARAAAHDPQLRTMVALALSRTLYAQGRASEAIEVLHEDALAIDGIAPEGAAMLERELRMVADVDLAVRPLARKLRGSVREAGAPHDTDPALCANHAVARLMSGDSAEIASLFAARALADGELHREANGGLYYISIFVLTNADRFEQAEGWMSPAVDAARMHGSAIGFALGAAQRAFLRSRQGALAEAEADARASLEIAAANDWPPLAQMALTSLIEVLIERGQPDGALEAARTGGVDLGELPPSTQGTVLLETRGRLRIAAGEAQAGIEDLLTAGERLKSWGMVNPAPFAWRSHAGLALARAGEQEHGRALVEEELAGARRWGAPRTLALALCAAGELARGDEQIETFAEAVRVLGDSGARLVRAQALTHLGAALRRANKRSEAREPLREGLVLARRCGATPLVHRAHTELWATGARPRTPLRTGIDALTASELRVARMAAEGQSNPAIAQSLFVTVKTIEMHLTSVYRKLDLEGRRDLPAALASAERDG